MPEAEIEADRALDPAATLEGVREAHHAMRLNVDDSHETREVVLSPAAGVRVNTGEADHTAEVVTGVEVDVAVLATPLTGVQIPVDGLGGMARTADLGLPNAHLAVMTGSFMTVQTAPLHLHHSNSHQTFLPFLHQEISLFLRLPRLDIKAPGHRHRLLRISPEVPRAGSLTLK